VIADPHTGGTMIVEFPSPSCVAHASTAVKQRIAAARLALIRSCGSPSSSHFTAIRGRATLIGVGFFDFQHGQSGVAPNAIDRRHASGGRLTVDREAPRPESSRQLSIQLLDVMKGRASYRSGARGGMPRVLSNPERQRRPR